MIVPISRRYEPGTLVIETTWVTDTGWVVVHDALTIAEWTSGGARNRPDTGHESDRSLLRTMTCIDGEVEMEMECLPRFAYGLEGATWSGGELGEAVARADDGTELRLTSDMELDDRRRHRARPPEAARGRERLLRADLGRARTRRTAQRPGGAGAARLDRRVLARVAARRATSPTIPGESTCSAPPSSSRASPTPRPGRSSPPPPPRCRRRRAANATGTTASAGSATRPSRLWALHTLGFDQEARDFMNFIVARLPRPPRPADHVRDRRREGADREHARPPRRLRRREAGADRQRRLRPAPERRLGRSPGLDLPARKSTARQRHSGRPRADRATRWKPRSTPGRQARPGDLGVRAASPSTTSPRS